MNTIKKGIVLTIGIAFLALLSALPAFAAEIFNNGLFGLYININESPYSDNWSNGNPYGPGGCTWFATSRVEQLTNIDEQGVIWGSDQWYSYHWEKYAANGFARGNTLDLNRKCLICWSGHIAVYEGLGPNGELIVSEGGVVSDKLGTRYSDYSYCCIRAWANEAELKGKDPGFLGYIYLPVPAWNDTTPPVISHYVDQALRPGKVRFTFGVTDNLGIDPASVHLKIYEYGKDEEEPEPKNAVPGKDGIYTVEATFPSTESIYWVVIEAADTYHNQAVSKRFGPLSFFEIDSTDCAGKYIVMDQDVVVHRAPYKKINDRDTQRNTVKRGSTVEVIGRYSNLYENTWYKLSDGGWIYSENVVKENSLLGFLARLMNLFYESNIYYMNRQAIYSDRYETTVISVDARTYGSANDFNNHISSYNDGYTIRFTTQEMPSGSCEFNWDEEWSEMNLDHDEGTCGEHLSWTMEDDGALTITGYGEMTEAPWHDKGYNEYITSLSLPDGLTSVCDYAFTNCVRLTRLVIPDSVRTLGEDCFSDCVQLREVTIPVDIQTAKGSSYSPFYKAGDEFAPIGTVNVEVIHYTKGATGVMPDMCDRGYTSEYMWDNKAYYFYGLAYTCASHLKRVDFGEGITRIGNFACCDLHDLETVTLPSTLESIGEHAFQDTVRWREWVKLPESVSTLGECCFYNSGILGIEFPDGLESLPDSCFGDCVNMLALRLPQGATSLGYACFRNCSGILALDFPAGLSQLPDECFAGCIGLRTVNIPDTIALLGGECFSGCSGLQTLTLPDTSIEVYRGCFTGCENLQSVKLWEDNQLASDCFTDCVIGELTAPAALWSVNTDNPITGCQIDDVFITRGSTGCIEDVDGNLIDLYSVPIKNIHIEEGVTYIGGFAFNGANVEHIAFPSTLSAIGEYAFYGLRCGDEIMTLPEGLSSLGEDCFYRANLKKLVLPRSLTEISEECFFWATIDEIVLPDTLTAISERAFECIKYGSEPMVIPDGVTAIGADAFNSPLLSISVYPYSEALEAVEDSGKAYTLKEYRTYELPSGLKRIESEAFAGVPAELVKVPSGCVSIGRAAFRDSSVRVIVLPEGIETIEEDAFDRCPLRTVVVSNADSPISEWAATHGYRVCVE